MTFAQRRNPLTSHFSERIPVVERRMTVFNLGFAIRHDWQNENNYCYSRLWWNRCSGACAVVTKKAWWDLNVKWRRVRGRKQRELDHLNPVMGQRCCSSRRALTLQLWRADSDVTICRYYSSLNIQPLGWFQIIENTSNKKICLYIDNQTPKIRREIDSRNFFGKRLTWLWWYWHVPYLLA